MRQKLRLKKKWMKAIHHAEFLRKCTETDRVPLGLRLQYSEIHMMDAPHTSQTRAAIVQAYKRAEHDICKALQEHYVIIGNQTENQLEEVDKLIQRHLERDSSESDKYKVFLSRLERTEDDIKSLLQEKRTHKLDQLNFSRRHTTTNTQHPQTPSSSLHTQNPYPNPTHSRSTHTQSRTPPTHSRTLSTHPRAGSSSTQSRTPYARPHTSSSPTEYQQKSTYPKKYLGQYPGRNKGKSPRRDESLNTPFRSPATSRIPERVNRHPLLPLPSSYNPQESPKDDMDLNDIKMTLNNLVSHLRDGIERLIHVHASRNRDYSGLLEWAPVCDEVTDCRNVDRIFRFPRMICDAPPLPSGRKGKDVCKVPPPCKRQSVCNNPSFPPIMFSPDVEPMCNTIIHNKCTPRFQRHFESPLYCQDSPLCLPSNIDQPLCDTRLPDPRIVQMGSKGPVSNTNVTSPTCLNTTVNKQPNTSNKECMPQDGLINLSDHKLSVDEISLLKKGLSFVPTPLKITTLNHERCLTKLRARYKYRFSLPTRTERLIDCTFEGIKYDLANTKILRPRTNLTKKERTALYRLKKNKDIIISKADKGDTTVIMNTSQLVELAHEHLGDSSTYQLLTHDPTPEVVSRFNHYIQECRKKGVISNEEFDRLYLPEDTSTQTIYFLPKLHKNPLRLRPIISCTNGPTQTASAFLDKLLQPHMKKTKSFLKNSTHLINILSNKNIPTNAFLITLDIESLYTNISHDQAIVTFLKIFKNHPQLVLLVDLLKYVLKSNIFKFDTLTFTQTCGLAMGTKLAPALATIYIGHLEEAFLSNRTIKPELWTRYIDDIFLVWAHSLQEFDSFFAELNNMEKRINFTAEISQHTCNFLDLTIYKPPLFHTTGLLATRIFYKPTNTFSFPLNTSYIPTHIHKGIAIGEMTRVIRNTTSPIICAKYKSKLMRHFRRRGYSKHVLKLIWNMKHTSRTAMLAPKKYKPLMDRRTPLCIDFAQCNPTIHEILTDRWKIMRNDFRLLTLFPNPPAPIFRSRAKLKSFLSKKRCTHNIAPSNPNLTPDKAKQFEFLKFNCPRPIIKPSR